MILAGCEVGEFEAGIVFAIAVNLQRGVLLVRGYHYLHFIILRVNLRIDFLCNAVIFQVSHANCGNAFAAHRYRHLGSLLLFSCVKLRPALLG